MSESGSSDSTNKPWMPPSIEELQTLIPEYEIEAVLGRGGMGAVYKGRQVSLGRDVAIKLLPATLIAASDASDDDRYQYVERFKREARAMANLHHPAIVALWKYGETAVGHLYFVMEYIDGMDIEQYIAACGGTVDPEHALAIIAHVLDALEYAHGRGIVHRDIKPANVLINQAGHVKLADFGLVKEFVDGDDAEMLSMEGLTRPDLAMGTPNYMAPETLDADVEADHRADLYAVGVMLYKMLTGKLPRGIFKLPSDVNPALDRRFDGLVAQGMAAHPEDRFQSASVFRSALEKMLSEPVRKVEPGQDSEIVEAVAGLSRLNLPKDSAGSERSRKRFVALVNIGVVVLCLAIVASVVVFLNGRDREGSEPEREDLAALLGVESEPIEPEMSPPGDSLVGEGELSPPVTDEVLPLIEPTVVMIGDVEYTSWQGELVEFRLLESAWMPETMTKLLAEMDRIHRRVGELAAMNLAGEGNTRVVLQASAEIRGRDYGFANKAGVIPMSANQLRNFISRFQDDGKLHQSTIFASLANANMRTDRAFTMRNPGKEYYGIHNGSRRFLALFVVDQLGVKMVDEPRQVIESGRAALVEYESADKEQMKQRIADSRKNKVAMPLPVDKVVVGILSELATGYGGEDFIRRFYGTEIPALERTKSDQDAFDNFYVAASRAAQSNLDDLFLRRLNVSVAEKVRAKVADLPSREAGRAEGVASAISTLSIDGVEYLSIRGERIEFQLLNRDYPETMVAQLVADLDAIVLFAEEISGGSAAGEVGGDVVIREDPNLKEMYVSGKSEVGPVRLSGHWMNVYLGTYADNRRLNLSLVVRSMWGIWERRRPSFEGGTRLLSERIGNAVLRVMALYAIRELKLQAGDFDPYPRLLTRWQESLNAYRSAEMVDWTSADYEVSLEHDGRTYSFTEMLAGQIIELMGDNIDEPFLRRLFAEGVAGLPKPEGNQEVFENVFLMLCRTAQADLKEPLVDELGWPIRPEVQRLGAEAAVR